MAGTALVKDCWHVFLTLARLFGGARFAQNASMIVTAAANITIWIATASSFQPCEHTRRCHAAFIRRVRALALEA